MPIGKVWIYRLLFLFVVCVFVCTDTDFSTEYKVCLLTASYLLTASNFARRFIGV